MIQPAFIKRFTYALLGMSLSTMAHSVENIEHLKPRPALPSDKATQYLLTDVDVVANKAIVVGDRGHILFSEDGGQSWIQAKVPVQQLITAVTFVNQDKGWAVGHEGIILHTEDGGKNWQLQYTNPYIELSNDELDQLTDDQFAKLPQKGAPLLDVWFRDESVGYAVGAYGMFLSTSNGGESWQDVSDRIDNIDGWHLNSIQGNGDGLVYLVGEKGVLFRSLDGGETWASLAAPYEGSFFNSLVGFNPNEVFIFGLQGNTFKSSDRGETWTKLKSNTTDGLMAGTTLGSDKLVLVGNSGVVLSSPNAGEDFNLKIAKDRKAILSVAQLPDGKLVMVGQGGVRIASSDLDSI